LWSKLQITKEWFKSPNYKVVSWSQCFIVFDMESIGNSFADLFKVKALFGVELNE